MTGRRMLRLLLAAPIWGLEWPVYWLARLMIGLDARLQRFARWVEGTRPC